jgi:hypothetical protein
MESWRKVWRDGISPHLSTAGLEALAAAILEDDPRLIQGATCSPPALTCTSDWPLEAADPIVFAFWQGDGVHTVGEGEECFAQVCFNCDQTIGEPAACRLFLNWYDETSREQMRNELLPEVMRVLNERAGIEVAA